MLGTEQAKDLASNETEGILCEYQAKIKEALQKEKDRFREFSKQEAEKTIVAANEWVNQIITEAQKEAERIKSTSRDQANQEAARSLTKPKIRLTYLPVKLNKRRSRKLKNVSGRKLKSYFQPPGLRRKASSLRQKRRPVTSKRSY